MKKIFFASLLFASMMITAVSCDNNKNSGGDPTGADSSRQNTEATYPAGSDSSSRETTPTYQGTGDSTGNSDMRQQSTPAQKGDTARQPVPNTPRP